MKIHEITDDFDLNHFYKIINNTEKETVQKIISKDSINFNEFLCLLSKNAVSCLPELAAKARFETIKRFGKIINFYIPVYLSNECSNQCVYCGFNHTKNISRKTLTLAEIHEEFIKIKKMGFDNILLLTGEDPNKAGIDYISESVKLAKEYFTFVGLEVYPLSIDEYSKLVNAGASGITVYQETYNRDTYKIMHIKGRKTDYNWRIETPSRAAEAGFRKIGMGALLGLSDWRFEAAMLALHTDFLQKKYWKAEYTLGFPRINPPSNEFNIPQPVYDRDLVQIICALRLFLKDVGFILTTRESPILRDNLIGLCITQISAGSKTNPGGYSTDNSGQQFSVHDTRDINHMIDVVKSLGYEAVLKDWDTAFNGVEILKN